MSRNASALRRIFDQGLKAEVGYLLPLRPQWERERLRWVSGPWFLRDERLYLIPGDSPMGFRLPLDSLPWLAPEDNDAQLERDPMAPRPKLPSRKELSEPKPGAVGAGTRGLAQKGPPGPGESDGSLTRTALCVEPRDGIIHVFMPPFPLLEEYLDAGDGRRGHGGRAVAAGAARGLPPAAATIASADCR